MKSLHWFRHDLRVQDNVALHEINKDASQLLCVYVIDDHLLETDNFDEKVALSSSLSPLALSSHRKQFLFEALSDLQTTLNKIGQTLYVARGNSLNTIKSLIIDNEIEVVSSTFHSGVNEKHQWSVLQNTFPNLQFIQESSNTIYELTSLPFEIENMPDTFSPFRRKVEKYCDVNLELKHIDDIAPPFEIEYKSDVKVLENPNPHKEYTGGTSAAIARIQEYFWQTDNIARYKETRNGLDGWDFSSRLSAWLSVGCISPKQVLNELKQYESEATKNESTYWLFFELLWREFFQWQLNKHGHLFFKKTGVQDKPLSTSFNHLRFEQWKSGETGYDIVDACMKQLNNTGFISNRGRQLVASCFVHELELDWRYGAAYFEHQLIDFDVASNYGNWQYLAGVGADPRGHRQFNLEKQTQTYDPQRRFIESWLNG